MKKCKFIHTDNRFAAMIRVGLVAAALWTSVGLQAQVTGVIRDAVTEQPLMGVQVRTADYSASAITDSLGEYFINAPFASSVLIISAPDYATREIALQGRDRVEVSLYSSLFSSGYGNIESLSGSHRKTVSAQAANDASGFWSATPVSIDSKIQDLLGGDVRAIHRSGVSGIGTTLFIRGLNSLNASAQPLFIIDGVVWNNQLEGASIHEGYFSNPLANINVKDIESITVLKDGNTIYGSKGANGVILINTMRAKEKATRITANLTWGVNTVPDLPKMMSADQYRTYASNQAQGFLNYYNLTLSEDALLRAFPFMDNDPSKITFRDYHNQTDWTKEIYRDGMSQDYSVSVSGGDDVAMFNLSMGYGVNEGVINNTDLERFTARFNSDVKMSSKLFAGIDLSVGQTTRNLRDDGADQVTSPGFIALIKAPLLSPYLFDKVTGAVSPTLSDYDKMDLKSYISNPLTLTDKATGSSSRVNFSMSLHPYYQFKKNLRVGTLFSYSLSSVKESFFIPQQGIAPRELPLNYMPISNEVRDLAQRQTSVFSNTYLKWDADLNKKYGSGFDTDARLNLLAGFRYQTDSYNWTLPSGYNTGNDNIKVLTSGLGLRSIIGDNSEWKSMSWYANVDFDYLRKYILTASFSLDASSRFGQATEGGFILGGVTWATFPSISAAWLVSSEDIMRHLPFINFLKLRASYGLTGNDGIDVNANRSYFQSVYYMGGAVGLQLANIQNRAIEWETSYKAGAGVDIHLLGERLQLSADVFSSRTKNLLTQKSLESFTGLSYYWSNGGALKNKGYEFGLNIKMVNEKDFKWELGGSLGHYKNEITALPDGDYQTEILNGTVLTAVGHPAGVFYGYKTKGVFATTAEAEASGLKKLNDNGTLSPYSAGDVWFDDPDGNGIITTKNNGANLKDDRQIIGDPNPDFYGTISNRFKYKRFRLDVLFTYSYGNDVYNYLRSQLESGATFYNQTTAMVNRWTTEGQVTAMPRAIYGDPMGNNAFSDRWIEDGSYLRLKTLTLSYEIPFNSIYLQGLTVWASANNLFTLSKYLGSDPEFSAGSGVLYQGIDAGLIPQSRSYFLGVKINL